MTQLRDRDRLRAALLSSLSHDLRTPLTAILAAAAELRRANAGDPALLISLESEAQRLDRFIGNLLDMVRIEAGGLRTSFSSTAPFTGNSTNANGQVLVTVTRNVTNAGAAGARITLVARLGAMSQTYALTI